MRLLALLVSLALPAHGQTLRLAVTTSFENSGLADVLLPALEAETGIEVRLLVVGTGQALRLGAAGDVDAVLVHARAAEEAFVAAGHGPHRREIMYNDFVLIGPEDDPAGIADASDAPTALARIAAARAPFVSRGDESGTHRAELALWE
ncbi:MAG: substrate-binding domain-containing protein, partial [Shimia sp.]